MKKIMTGTFAGLITMLLTTTAVSAQSYVVTKGDNLWNIAQENNTTMKKLMDINGLDSTLIHPDQVLELKKEVEKPSETYNVKQGDNLYHIGKKLGVTVDELMIWNELDTTLIHIGQKLIIKDNSQVNQGVNSQKDYKINDQKTSVTEKKVKSKPVKKEKTQVESKKTSGSSQEVKGKTISVKATAYTAQCKGCSGVTSTGIDLNRDRQAKVIAVDPSVIPLGTKVYVEGYGHAVAGDVGGAIKGNRIDIHVPTKDEAYNWGVRNVNVTILE